MQNLYFRAYRVSVLGALALLVPFSDATLAAAENDPLTPEEREWLADHPVIRVRPGLNYPPADFADEEGEFQGIAADYVRLIELKLGVRFQISNRTQIRELRERNENPFAGADVVPLCAVTPARTRRWLWTELYLEFPAVIIVRDNVEDSLGLEQLSGMRVAVVRGWAAHEYMTTNFLELEIDAVADTRTGLRKVSFGMVDAFVSDLAVATYLMQEEGITNLRVAGETGYVYRMGMATRKDWPELDAILEKGLALITPDERRGIYEKWVRLEERPSFFGAGFWMSTLVGLGMLGLLSIGFIVWNRSLAGQVKERTGALERELNERRQAEQALQRHERFSERLIASTMDGIIAFDRECRLTIWNPAMQRNTGLGEDTTLGRCAFEVAPFLKEIGEDKYFFEALEGKTVVTRDRPFTIPETGKQGFFEGYYSPLRNEAGEVIGGLCIIHDITERKNEAAALQNAQKLESLGLMAGGIAHDFNNLLTAVLGNASLALRDLEKDSPARGSLREIENAAESMAELAGQMLAYAGKGQFVVSSIDLSEVVRQMGALLRGAMSKKTELRFEFEESLPRIDADSAQLKQVVMNLITNASEAMGEQGGTIHLRTGVRAGDSAGFTESYLHDELPAGEYVYLQVADTGCGMDEATKSKIFDPFFTTKFTGRGLGMAAILGIVRAHRGAIQIDSELGKGTTITVIFPSSASQSEEHSPRDAPAPETACPAISGTILVVDDEGPIRELIRDVLKRAGFEVLTACEGKEAVDIFAAHASKISLVILDLTMPRLDGHQAFIEMKRIRPETQVILCSGFSEQDATERFGSEGLAGFLQKPFMPDELVDAVQAILNNQPDRKPVPSLRCSSRVAKF